jgi:hypothetical protein
MDLTPTHYFLDAGHCTQPKNKLETEFVKFLLNLNGILIVANERTAMVNYIMNKQNDLNAIHSRCKPIKTMFWSYRDDGDLALQGCCIVFKIKKAKILSTEDYDQVN